jgi:hypothetical protein
MLTALSASAPLARSTNAIAAARLLVLAGISLFFAPAAKIAAAPPATPAAPPAGIGCVHIGALEILLAPLDAAPQAQKQPSPEDIKGPMNEREVELLLRALEPVEIDKSKGKGRTIRAVAEGTELSLARLHVLIGDVLGILTEIHARENLADLKKIRDVPQPERKLAGEMLDTIGRCVRFRFEERGGLPTLRESRRIVEKYRNPLEKFVLTVAGPPDMLPR